jgi:hypothetical protein
MTTRRRTFLAIPTAAIVAVLAATPALAATPTIAGSAPTATHAAPAATPQGIIMRDGGICDPIRWGC